MKPTHFFGTTRHWATKQESIEISDLERTIVDGLRQPAYCGGVTEVAKGLWMRRQDMQVSKLVDYALRLGTGAVIRRLGYLLEQYNLAPTAELDRLRKSITAAYVKLDPMLPKEGPHLSRWRLQTNITAQELGNIRETCMIPQRNISLLSNRLTAGGSAAHPRGCAGTRLSFFRDRISRCSNQMPLDEILGHLNRVYPLASL